VRLPTEDPATPSVTRPANGRFTGDPNAVSDRMRRIRSSNTKPELAFFEVLEAAALPYQPHVRVEGITVDALVSDRVALFVDSPFWHLRDDSELERLSTYWRGRLLANRARDARQNAVLRRAGFPVVRIWTDELRDPLALSRVRRAVRRRRG
jgi:DNA mismatch endonuclease (patch repair protein)